mmetsp:Transcript_83897/g.234174  ORF Transcript_83897/g.234174 Transcript_83897/m.234174 type:complete len:254 (+) Transcript_83897:872-1633(+)
MSSTAACMLARTRTYSAFSSFRSFVDLSTSRSRREIPARTTPISRSVSLNWSCAAANSTDLVEASCSRASCCSTAFRISDSQAAFLSSSSCCCRLNRTSNLSTSFATTPKSKSNRRPTARTAPALGPPPSGTSPLWFVPSACGRGSTAKNLERETWRGCSALESRPRGAGFGHRRRRRRRRSRRPLWPTRPCPRLWRPFPAARTCKSEAARADPETPEPPPLLKRDVGIASAKVASAASPLSSAKVSLIAPPS